MKMGWSSRRGFTLVELLVVIGIIGILLALLAPSLRTAFLKAKEVQCLTNVQQLAMGLGAYAAAHHGRTFKQDPVGGWMKSMDEFVRGGHAGQGRFCPRATTPAAGAWQFGEYSGSYAINSALYVPPENPPPTCFTTLSQADSRVPAFVDGTWFETKDVATVPWDKIAERHRKAVCISFADAHAERVERAQVLSQHWNK